MKKLLFALTLVGATSASFGQVLFSHSFEGLNLGGIAGQGGFDAGSDSDILVSNARAFSGTQSAQVNTDSAGWPSGSGWAWAPFSFNAATAPYKIVETSAKLWVETGTNTISGSTQATRAYGFDAYDASGARIIAARVLSATGQLQTVLGNTATTQAFVAPRDTWIDFKLTLDYNTNLASVTINNVVAASGIAFAGTTLADVDLYGIKSVPTGTSTTGKGYFDDYKVEAVPEPATLLALGLGAAALVRRRRA